MRDRLGLFAGTFDVLTCDACGSARLGVVPSARELQALYPEEYSIRGRRERGALLDGWARLELRLFYDRAYRSQVRAFLRLTGVRAGKLLDVGCGNGRRMAIFARHGFSVEGIDPAPGDVAYVREELGFPARCGTLRELAYPAASFDAVTFYNVLEHLPDPAETLQEVFRILRPGGVVFAVVPVIDGLQSRLFGRSWIEVREMPRHVFVPRSRALLELLQRSGFADGRAVSAGIANLAHSMAESLWPWAIGAAAYRTRPLRAVAARAVGAAVLLLCLPAAALEKCSGAAGVRFVCAVKPPGRP
jgi:SAM-dependent methyltransferase